MTKKTKIMLLCWILILMSTLFLNEQEEKTTAVLPKIAENKTKKTEEVPETKEETAQTVQVTDTPGNLHALSAVLMDGATGRVLFEKEGQVARPNASTTKVLTCILALENARGDEIVETSARAAGQPDVQLNMIEGEKFYMEDLLHSLMLRSHNDAAVAIAEHISGSVEKFAVRMNEKAKELGCKNTHFITPNGLDESDAGGVHSTTAEDLAKIMSYAIQNETFLKITQTREYRFWDVEHKRQFQVTNANAFLDMMDGVISGKTGFTADAGYCYVCALKRDGRVFVVALLGCGWPNHKTYKWADSREILTYGLENYENRSLWQEPNLTALPVEDAVPPEGQLKGGNQAELCCVHTDKEEKMQALLRKDERIQMKYRLPEKLKAPVKKGQKVGEIQYYLDGKVICQFPVVTCASVDKLDFTWCVEQIFHRFFR